MRKPKSFKDMPTDRLADLIDAPASFCDEDDMLNEAAERLRTYGKLIDWAAKRRATLDRGEFIPETISPVAAMIAVFDEVLGQARDSGR